MTETSSDGTVAHDSDDLRESIKSNAGQHQFLSAGAGAGKTTMLVEHYLHLLGLGYKPAQLVAVTFTAVSYTHLDVYKRQPLAGLR